MNKLRFSMITILMLGLNVNLQAVDIEESNSIELDSVTVTGESDNDPMQKKVGERVKSAKTLTKEQVQDTRDLVKYETGVSVVETGRFGASGYAIRGVDENRVAITIDGLHQAETLSSQGFKEIFEGYGNFNNTRNGVEIQTLKQATITKGADSIKTGSGALGGSVMFETKDARDYLLDKDYFYGFKTGLSTANSQRYGSHTLAARYKWFDVLLINTKRKLRETKNYGYDEYDDSVLGREREKADPYNIKKESTLLKFGFQPADNARISIAYDNGKVNSKGHDFSYTLTPKNITNTAGIDKVIADRRYTNDTTTRKNFSATYEVFSEMPFWDSIKITYSDQKIKARARTDETCEGPSCQNIQNHAGLHIKDNKTVDKDDQELSLHSENGLKKVKNHKEEDTYNKFVATKRLSEYKFYCDLYDCDSPDKKIKLVVDDTSDYAPGKRQTVEVDLTKKEKQNISQNGKNLDFTIEDKVDKDNRRYKKILAEYKYKGGFGNDVTAPYEDLYVFVPNQPGFIENQWKERDLNTDTKQFNLDFTKNLELKNLEHYLQYGLSHASTKKSMINKAGYNAKNPQWWADSDGDCSEKSTDIGNALKCPKTEKPTSFLIPVESDEGALYLKDEIHFSDQISLDIGFRHDRVKYRPNYIPGRTPKIADDMVKGLFVPLKPKRKLPEKAPDEANSWDKPTRDKPKYFKSCKENNKNTYTCPPDKKVIDEAELNKDLKEFEEKDKTYKNYLKDVEYNKLVDKENETNPQKNIEYFSQPREFKNNSYALAATLDPTEFVRVQVKYSKGFRVPTHEELYLAFKHPDFTIKPNVDLKPEIAKTKEIALTLHKNMSFLTMSIFKTEYKDFLDLEYKGTEKLNQGNQNNNGTQTNSSLDFDIYQNVNRQDASVNGFEISSRLNFEDIYSKLSGFYIGYKLTNQRGSILTKQDGNVPMNAIQPKKSIYSFGYTAPNDTFGVDFYLTSVKAKKPNETYNMFWKNEKPNTPPDDRDYINGKLVTDSSAHWLSNKYNILDMIAYVRPKKNLTFRLGAYNITDEKYITWDSARSIRSFGTMNMVRKTDSLGINRFNAPGRNFKLDFEFTY
ncbi:TonB-dependent hemoglobin/transferrin/lactoferrin receptor family protein [Campylobacter pinnipediorum subsp. caledonicus]|uniref:TonB-dependent hemoglobin/transferrin/lactoferrin receptor family protein n=1 Tax=Campylobacter pinnipediorum subsp. caledonicus TaxID=1874362 RepID=A0A1S6U7W5_9BACT|nr:TonB-dependent receptor [Campylobacter pinnipediorum]AQW87813.1 TonB-dependent hemoglobin/transferrin/lactoferrin receptor family protein [Campylobacter pinnipediorum subsp. caledonicus]